MSNTIGSAVIEVGVDTKGIESGFAKIDGAVTKTGKTLESLSGQATKGFGDIGAGGDQSAKKVEAATKNMVGAIQRTTAAMESGSKTSAKYYETLASQRGVNVEALRPYLAQLDAVKAKQEAAAKAAAATSNSVAQLGGAVTKIDGITKSAGASLLSFGKSFLLGAAVGLSYDALKGKIFGVIDSMAGLKTLSEKTGSSVENLSKLAFAAKQSGSDIDSVAGALAKLAKGMAGADADSKGAGLALKFLGLSAKDAAGNLKDPAAMFTEIAKKFALYQDGAGKVALAQALLGKSGADMLPTLKLIGEQGEIAAKVTDAQATAARQYNRDMAKLTAQQGLLYKTIATAVLPTMTDFANVLLDASKNANLTNGAVKGLAEDGSITDWADSASMALAFVIDTIKVIPPLLSTVFAGITDVAAIAKVAVLALPGTMIVTKMSGGKPIDNLKAALKEQEVAQMAYGDRIGALLEKDVDATRRGMQAKIDARKADAASAAKSAAAPATTLLNANFDTSNEDGKAADKAAAAAKKQAEAYATLIASIKTKTAESKLELATGQDATESQKIAIKLDQDLASGKVKLSAAQRAAAGAAIEEFAASESLEKSKKSVAAASQVLTDERSASYAAAVGEAAANEELVRTFGLSKTAIEKLTLARLEDRLAQRGPQDLDLSEADVAATERLIEVKKRLIGTSVQLESLSAGTDVAKAKELLDILVAVDNAAKQAADGMAASFGRVGSAIGGLTTALTGYAVQQQAIAAQLASSKFDAKGDPDKIAKAEMAASKASAQAQVKSYGDMAGAAKGFFKENTAGYKVLQTTEKAFRAFEMAMAIESMVTKLFATEAVTTAVVAGKGFESIAMVGAAAVDTTTTGVSVANSAVKTTASTIAGVAKAFEQMGVYGFIGAAAIIAFMASMGSGASGGGGAAPTTFEDRQKTQGTGTVLGDSSEKSNSIANSLEIIKTNSGLELNYQNSMLQALKNIESALSGAAKGIFQTAGLTGGSAFGTVNESTKSTFGADKSTTITDTGIKFTGSLGDLRNGTGTGNQYEDVTKTSDGGWFHGNSSNSFTNTKALSDAALKPFTLIFDSMGDLLVGAGVKLGSDSKGLTDAINQITIDFAVSTRDLKGQDLVDALSAGVSVAFDQVTTSVFPQIAEFQKVGEGMGETLVRVASDYAAVDSIMASVSTTFGATGMASVAAREHLIELAGGIDALSSQTSSFASNFLSKAEQLAPVQKYVTDQLAAMGLQSLTTRDQFKDYLKGLADSGALLNTTGDITTRSQAQYVALLALSEAYAKTHAATVDLTKSEQDIADERKDLQAQYDELVMTTAQLAAKARAEIAPYNLALYDSIQAEKDKASAMAVQADIYELLNDKAALAALHLKENAEALAGLSPELAAVTKHLQELQDRAAAATSLLTAVDSAFATLQKVIALEKAENAKAHDIEMKALEKRITVETAAITKMKSLSDALKSALDSMNVEGTSDVDARAVGQAQIQAALAIAKAGGPLPDADSLKAALSSVTKDASDKFATYDDYLTDFYRTQNDIAALGKITDASLSIEQKTLDLLTAQKDASQLAYDAEVARLDGILQNAQTEIDALKGIDTSLLTINQTLLTLSSAILAAQANPTLGSLSGITKAYQDSLGRAPDKAGLDYWSGVAGGGTSVEDIAGQIANSPEAKIQSLYKSLFGRTGDAGGLDYWIDELNGGMSVAQIKALMMSSDEYTKSHKVPGFAGGGDFAGGLRVVGETGPELEATGPSRIFNASQTRSMLGGNNNDALIAELRAQRDEQRDENDKLREIVESHLYAIAKNTLNTADVLEAAVSGDVPIAVKSVEETA